MRRKPSNSRPVTLDSAALELLALNYAARYATTRARLRAYLLRKLAVADWTDSNAPNVDAMVARLADLRYVDDAAFAQARGAALTRRGYGGRRIRQALQAAGVEQSDSAPVVDHSRQTRWAAAASFARRKRIGPYGLELPSPDVRKKQIAAFLRAGHDFSTALSWIDAAPGCPPEAPDDSDSICTDDYAADLSG